MKGESCFFGKPSRIGQHDQTKQAIFPKENKVARI